MENDTYAAFLRDPRHARAATAAPGWPWWLGGLVLGALCRGLVAGYEGELSHDAAAYYLPAARAIRDGDWESLNVAVGPLYPALVAAVSAVVPDLEAAGLLVSVLAGAFTVIPVVGLVRFFFPGARGAQRAVLFLWALQPLAVRLGGSARGDALYALLFATAAWAGLWMLEHRRPSSACLFGAATGVAYLVRPEALGLPVLAALAVLVRVVHARGARGAELRSWLLPGVLAVAALLPSLLGYMNSVHDRLGVWTLSPKAGMHLRYRKHGFADTLGSIDATGTRIKQEAAYSSAGHYTPFDPVAALNENPVGLTWSYVRNLAEFLRDLPGELGYALTVLLVLGAWRARDRGLRVMLVTLGFFALSVSLFYVSRRFWLPLIPLTLPWVGVGLMGTSGGARRMSRGLVLAIVLVVVATLPQTVRRVRILENHWRASPERTLGERFAATHGSGHPILSRKGRVTWYAAGEHRYLPALPVAELTGYMESASIHYLVIDAQHADRLPEGLLADLERHPRFTELDCEQSARRSPRIYEFR